MKVMVKTCLMVALMTLSLPVLGTDCTNPDITLNSQAEVDNFQADYGGVGGCDTVTGTLWAEGNDIYNLDGLAGLVNVEGTLWVFQNPVLTNLSGLANLTNVGGNLYIQINDALTNLDGLANLTDVSGDLAIQNNAALTNLEGLAQLTNFNGVLFINFSPALTNLNGLDNLTSVAYLQISSNPALTNLDGLANLTSVGALTIESNATLTNLDAFANLTSVGGDLFIYDNAALASCYGLATVLDEIDDAGPGPGSPPIPDVGGLVTLENNLPGCNSVAEALIPPVVTPVPASGPFALVLLTCLMLLSGITGVRRQA
jgi:hypothetical protein